MPSDDVRAELTRRLTEYLQGHSSLREIRDWAANQQSRELDEPLRADLAAIAEAASDVEADQRSEREFRELAAGMTRDVRE